MQADAGNSSASAPNQIETQSKNLELLMSILKEFSQDELDKEIFTLHEVSKTAAKPKSKKSPSKD